MLVSVLTIFALTACGCRNSKPAQTSPTTLPTVTTAPTTEMTTVPTTQMTEPTNATIQDGNGPLPGDMTDATDGTIVDSYYLEGKELSFVDRMAFEGTVAAHVDGGVPVITMDCGELDDRKVGELFYFLELACGVSAYILGVNPFNQPGVELYKRNMFELLGKPGY